METFALDTTCRHMKIQIATERPFEFIDVTPDVETLVTQTGIDVGFVNVQSLHTTTSIVVNEHEPQLLTDFAELLERAAPPSASYRHDDAGAPNGQCDLARAHQRAFALSSAVVGLVSLSQHRQRLFATWALAARVSRGIGRAANT